MPFSRPGNHLLAIDRIPVFQFVGGQGHNFSGCLPSSYRSSSCHKCIESIFFLGVKPINEHKQSPQLPSKFSVTNGVATLLGDKLLFLLRTYNVTGCITWLQKRVTFLSLKSLSRLTAMHIAVWFNAYLMIKLFHSLLSWWRGFLKWKKFSFLLYV